jgi:hypothetical protein
VACLAAELVVCLRFRLTKMVDRTAYHIGRTVVPLIADIIADSEISYGLKASDVETKCHAFEVCMFLNFVALYSEIVLF